MARTSRRIAKLKEKREKIEEEQRKREEEEEEEEQRRIEERKKKTKVRGIKRKRGQEEDMDMLEEEEEGEETKGKSRRRRKKKTTTTTTKRKKTKEEDNYKMEDEEEEEETTTKKKTKKRTTRKRTTDRDYEEDEEEDYEEPAKKKKKSSKKKTTGGTKKKKKKRRKSAYLLVESDEETKESIMEENDDVFDPENEKVVVSVDELGPRLASKMGIYAARRGDKKMMRDIIKNKDIVQPFAQQGSQVVKAVNVISECIERNDVDMLKTIKQALAASIKVAGINVNNDWGNSQLVKVIKEPYRGSDKSYLKVSNTGSMSTYHRRYRRGTNNLNQARGGKDGNDAFSENKVGKFANYESNIKRYKQNTPNLDKLLKKAKYTKEEDNVLMQLMNYPIHFYSPFETSTTLPNFNTLSKEIEVYANQLGPQAGLACYVLYGNMEPIIKVVEDDLKRDQMMRQFNDTFLKILKNQEPDRWMERSLAKKCSTTGITPIHVAARMEDTTLLEGILARYPYSFSTMDNNKVKPGHYAAAAATSKNIELLIKAGWSPADVSNSKMTAIHIASMFGRIDTVKALLKHDSNLLKQKDKWGRTAIHFATQYNQVELLKLYLTDYRKMHNLNGKTKLGSSLSALMMACDIGHLECVKAFVELGANVVLTDKRKRPCIFHAVIAGQYKVVQYLLHYGFNPNSADNSGNTLVHYAAGFGWINILKLLHRAGADLAVSNQWNTSPLMIAGLNREPVCHRYLRHALTDYNIDETDINGKSVLFHMIEKQPNKMDVEFYLKTLRANPQVVDESQNNVFHALVKNKPPVTRRWNYYNRHQQNNKVETDEEKSPPAYLKIADLLLKHIKSNQRMSDDPDDEFILDRVNHNKNSPLYVALKEGQTHYVNWLLKNGASVQERDFNMAITLQSKRVFTNILEHQPLIKESYLKQLIDNVALLTEVFKIIDHVDVSYGIMVEIIKRCHQPEYVALLGLIFEKGHIQLAMTHDEKQAYLKEEKDSPLAAYTSQNNFFHHMVNIQSNQPFSYIMQYVKTWAERTANQALVQELLLEPNQQGLNVLQLMIQMSSTHSQRIWDIDMLQNPLLPTADSQEPFHLFPYMELLRLHNVEASSVALDGLKKQLTFEVTNMAFCAFVHDLISYLKQLSTATSNPFDLNRQVQPIYEDSIPVRRIANYEHVGKSIMHFAIERSNIDLIELLALVHHAKLELKDHREQSPLFYALRLAAVNLETFHIVKFLLYKGVNYTLYDHCHRNILHHLFIVQKPSVSKEPIEQMIDIINLEGFVLDEPDCYGRSPLHYACYAGNNICAMFLMQRQCDIERFDETGNTPLAMTMLGKHQHFAANLLHQVNINVTIVPTPDIYITRKTLEDRSAKYLEHKAAFVEAQAASSTLLNFFSPYKVYEKDHKEVSLMKYSLYNQWYGLVYLLISKGVEELQAIDDALAYNSFKAAQKVLEGATANALARSINGNQNIFHIISKYAPPEAKQFLVHKLLRVLKERNVQGQTEFDDEGMTPLHYAATSGNVILLEYLLPFGQMDVPDKKNGRTPLLNAVISQRTACIHALLNAKCNITAMDRFNHNCVIYSPLDNHKNLELLLNAGANPNVVYTTADALFVKEEFFLEGVTPLQVAVRRGHWQSTEALLKAGANPNAQNAKQMTAFHYVVRHLTVMNIKKDYDAQKAKGVTLHNRTRFRIMMNHFLKRGANPNIQNEKGQTPAMVLLRQNLLEMFSFMTLGAQQSVEPNLQDLDGNTLGHYALEFVAGYGMDRDFDLLKELFSTLQQLELDITIQNVVGESPLYLAAIAQDGGKALGAIYNAYVGRFHLNLKGNTRFTFDDPAFARLVQNYPQIIEKARTYLIGLEEASMDKPFFDALPPMNEEADYDAVLTKLEKELEEEEGKEDEKPMEPIALSGLKYPNTTVATDDDTDRYYYALLNKTTIDWGDNGCNNFYCLQVVYNKSNDIYFLLNHFGVVGDAGQCQRTPYPYDECIAEFKKLFKSKTGQVFSFSNSPDDYPMKKGKYKVIALGEMLKRYSITHYTRKIKAQYEHMDKHASALEKLEPHLYEKNATDNYVTTQLLAILSNFKNVQEYIKYGIDFNRMLKNKTDRQAIEKAFSILAKISKCNEVLRKIYVGPERVKAQEEITELSREFFTIIPFKEFRHSSIKPIISQNDISSKHKLLTHIRDFSYYIKLVLNSYYKPGNKINYIYNSLRTRITPLDQTTAKAKFVSSYFKRSLPHVHIADIFELNQEGIAESTSKYNHEKRMLLWHGTSASNIFSILRYGLMKEPPGVLINGNMFGTGIYFADQAKKSYGYTRPCEANYISNFNILNQYDNEKLRTKSLHHTNLRFMFLADVAVGDSKEFTQAENLTKPPNGYQSVLGRGRAHPDKDIQVRTREGAVAPIGNILEEKVSDQEINPFVLANNEYIVYDDDRVRLRYLLVLSDKKIHDVETKDNTFDEITISELN